MDNNDFEADRGSGAIITAFAVLAIVALAALYMLFPVDRDTGGKDIPQASASESGGKASWSIDPSGNILVSIPKSSKRTFALELTTGAMPACMDGC